MANISAIKLPNGTTYTLKDNGALQLTGGQVTGPVTFGDSVSIDSLTAGDLVVNGSASFTNNIQANTINGVTVGSSPKFTDTNTEVSTLTLAAGSTAGTALTSGGKFTLTAGSKTVSFTMPTIPTIPSNNITGSGTSGKVVKFTGTNTIGDGWSVTDNTTSTAVTSTDTNLITARTLYYAGYTKNTGTITGVTAGTGLSGGGTSGSVTLNHSNSVTAQTTQAVYPIKIDAQGHISAYGSAVTIPGVTKTTATLSTTWSSNQQSVTVSGVTTSNTVIVTPAPASYNMYCECGVYCSAQAANSLTFTCDEVPTSSLTVNIVILS